MLSWVVAIARFLTEIALWLGAGYLGWALVSGWPRWILGSVGIVVILVAWARWVAPRASRRLPDPPRLVLEFALFVGVGLLLLAFGQLWWGLTVALLGSALAAVSRRVALPA